MKDLPEKQVNSPEQSSLLSIFLMFLKTGSLTFGGGIAMIPLLQVELVEKKHWLSERNFAEYLTVAQSVPGPIVINLALVVGYRIKGLKGATSALLGMTIPSFLLLLVIAMFLWHYRDNPLANAAFRGIGPVVAALIASAAIKLGKRIIEGYTSAMLLIFFIAGLYFLNIHPLFVIISGMLVGLFFLSPELRKKE